MTELSSAHQAVFDIKKFCASGSVRFDEPCVRDGRKFATNGSILVEVAAAENEANIGHERFPFDACAKILAAFDVAPLADLPDMSAALRCGKCDGTGLFECRACHGDGYRECDMGHEHDCDRCGGDGVGPCDHCENRSIDVYGERIAIKHARLIAGLPGPVRVSPGNDMVLFTFAGGRGAVVPLARRRVT